ncbi:MAG TPA: carboxypeptidase regulatory-like domain-containing protein [Sedimentisphaerales bacterium]|nr:carboxypeptidase regulatory-like domain-containing protein [Sedimentisphaerales bacterium]
MMEKVKVYLVIMGVLGLLSLAGFVLAEDGAEPVEPRPRVTGTAKDQAGNPVAGVQIGVLSVMRTPPTTLTDAAGKFDIGGWKPGLEPSDGICLIARQIKLNLAARLDLPQGSNREDIDFELAPAISWRGTVTDPDNKPIGRARVSIVMGTWEDDPLDGAVTDIKGRYEFKAMPQRQEYFIRAEAEGYGRGKVSTGLINNTKDIGEVQQIILKPANMSVSGVVIDVDGRPVPNAEVQISTPGTGQPERKTKTDSQGRFTLTRICDGSFTLDVGKGHHLTGYVPNVQAGAEDVKIVVFQWPPKERVLVESPFEANPQAGVLKYRWSERGWWRLLEGKDSQRIQMTTRKPAGVNSENLKNDNVLFGQWHSPAVKGGYRWIALDRTHEHGPYDRLIMDTNGDGHLDDEMVTLAYTISQPSIENYGVGFGAVRVLLDEDSGPQIYHLGLFYQFDRVLFAGSSGWYEGYVTVGGIKQHCLLVDKDSNGTFDTKSQNPGKCDLIAFGEEDGRIVRFVGNFVEIDGALYRLDIARDGEYMNVNLTAATDVKFGTVKLQGDITEFAAGGENGLFAVKPTNGVAKLPVGKYRIDHWLIEREDEKGRKWTLEGHSFDDCGIFEVREGAEISLWVGEPIFGGVDQISERGTVYSFVNPNICGRLGECLELGRGDDFIPTQLRIRSKDGSYDRSFTFEYG